MFLLSHTPPLLLSKRGQSRPFWGILLSLLALYLLLFGYHLLLFVPLTYGRMANAPARWWMGTISSTQVPDWSATVCYGANSNDITELRGQQELGTGGFLHWQVVVGLAKPQRLSWLVSRVGRGHWERTRSAAAREYVHKVDTRVADTQFNLGAAPTRRNVAADWAAIKENAQAGALDRIPADIYIRCYNQLKRIAGDHAIPPAVQRRTAVYWGATGTGKTYRAYQEAAQGSVCPYFKDPCTKWWDGYQGSDSVIIDEVSTHALINLC